jgi:Mrp family chromosome partitioning ATPase
MAKFKDSAATLDAADTTVVPEEGPAVADRSIGSIIAETRHLSAEQVEKVLRHQREKGIRFGEAAIALGYASTDDVLFALSQQFHYPYAAEDRRKASPELVALNQPFGVQAESFRAIRSQIMMRLFNEGQERRAIAVVSPDAGDGKTFFSANDAGLSGILSGRAEAKVIQQVPGVPSLFVLPVGITPPNPLELVERPAFGLLIRELLSKFDHVVVDTPAAQYGSDSAAIAARCGAALVVARQNKSQVVSLQDLVANLAETPAKLAGVIVNEF